MGKILRLCVPSVATEISNIYTIFLNAPFVTILKIRQMAKDNLETKVKKSVLKIEKSVSGIYNVITDFSLKMCHIIERMGDQYFDRNQSQYYSGNLG